MMYTKNMLYMIYCPKCSDMVRVRIKTRTCYCGESFGFTGYGGAPVYGGKAIPISVNSKTLQNAVNDFCEIGHADTKLGYDFTAYIPNIRPTDTRTLELNWDDDESCSSAMTEWRYCRQKPELKDFVSNYYKVINRNKARKEDN